MVAVSWCDAELAAGNAVPGLAELRQLRLLRLQQRLADPRHLHWLDRA
jgi:hypothetical protein